MMIGTYRRLMQCSDAAGAFVVLALDHRDNLIAELQKHQVEPVTYADVVAFKTSVCQHLSDQSSAVLTDPDYGMPGIIAGAIPGRVGLIAPLEVTDYSLHMSQRQPRLIPGWDVEKLVRAGFSAAKLLLYYHPESADAQLKTDLVDQIVAQCHAAQIPLFLEPLVYSLDPARSLSNDERRQLVVATTQHFSARGVTILKLEFPLNVAETPDETAWLAALHQVNQASQVPWTLLSGGIAFETFLRQATLACQAGASGVMVGRAVWAEATALRGAEREHFLRTTARERMIALQAACQQAIPWTQQHHAPPVTENWYLEEFAHV